jgi:hypothetical protein
MNERLPQRENVPRVKRCSSRGWAIYRKDDRDESAARYLCVLE